MNQIVYSILLVTLVMVACSKDQEVATSKVLKDVTSLSEYSVKISNGVSLLFFHATWCPKCSAQRPAIEQAADDASLKGVFFGQVDYEKVTEVVKTAKVVGFPTMVFYKDGAEVARFSGQGHSHDKIKNQLTELLQ